MHQSGQDAAGEEAAAVFAQMPALVVCSALIARLLKFFLRALLLAVFRE
jgi:hypothetical protein